MCSRLKSLHQPSEQGMTLIEMLISMTIFSLVIAAAYSALLVVQKQTKDTTARDDAVSESRLGIASMDRQIRSGNVLYDPAEDESLGYPMSMRVFTQANSDQKCVQWQVSAGTLRTRRWNRDGSNVSDWSVVAHWVVNSGTLEKPFSLSGSALTPYSARVVNIFLRVKSPDAGGQPVDVRTSLTGRNTVYGYDQSVCSPIPAG